MLINLYTLSETIITIYYLNIDKIAQLLRLGGFKFKNLNRLKPNLMK